MSSRLPASAHRGDAGVTLVELVIALVIMGVLSAIAVPVYLAQRQESVDSSTRSQVLAVAQEVDGGLVATHRYPGSSTFQDAAAVLPRTVLTGGTTVQVKTNAAATAYCVRGYASGGTASGPDRAFWYDSTLRGFVSTTAGPAPAATGRAC